MNVSEFKHTNDLLRRQFAGLETTAPRNIEEWKTSITTMMELLSDAMSQLRIAETQTNLYEKSPEIPFLEARIEPWHYRDYFVWAPISYVFTDPLGLIVEVNQAAAQLLGDSPDSFVGRPLDSLIVMADRQRFHEELIQIKRGESPRELVVRLSGDNPSSNSLVLRGARQLDQSQNPLGVRWIILEIAQTSRVDPPEACCANHQEHQSASLNGHSSTANASPDGETEKRLRHLVQRIAAIVWEATPDGAIRFVNRWSEKMLGYPNSRWSQRPEAWIEIVHPEDRKTVASKRIQCFHDGCDVDLEYRVITSDRRVLWLHEAIRAIRDESGRAIFFYGVIWNIEGRKKGELHQQELQQDLAGFEQLVEFRDRGRSTAEPIPFLQKLLETALKITGGMAGVVRLLDSTKQELEIVASTFVPEAYLRRNSRSSVGVSACGMAIEQREAVFIEDMQDASDQVSLRSGWRLGGHRAEFSTPIINREGEQLGTIGVFFRAPHRPSPRRIQAVELLAHEAAAYFDFRRLENELQKSRSDNRAAMAILAHELRTPLEVILNSAYALRLADFGEKAIVERSRELITRQASRMARLVDDLLAISRVAQGEIQLSPELIDANELFARVSESILPVIRRRGHELAVEVSPDGIQLEADPARLEQILLNLLTNAARYTEAGGSIVLHAHQDNESVVLSVKDTGVGVRPENRTRIFEPFFQEGDKPSHFSEGIGLGLSLVKELVKRHGGSVSCESAGPGTGSEFIVRLPVKFSGFGTTRPAARSQQVSPTSERKKLRVLVVDDQADAAQSLAQLLGLWGHTATIAYNGESAIRQVGTDRPDVVLLDIGLPDINGHEVARRLREVHGVQLKLIALTGFNRQDHDEPGQSSFDGYLIKSGSPEELHAALER